MSDRLKLDGEVLASLHRSMDQIRDVIGDAVHLADHTISVCGDGELGARLRDFEHDWESTRNDMMETIAKFAGMVSTVTESFDQLEQKLTEALLNAKQG